MIYKLTLTEILNSTKRKAESNAKRNPLKFIAKIFLLPWSIVKKLVVYIKDVRHGINALDYWQNEADFSRKEIIDDLERN